MNAYNAHQKQTGGSNKGILIAGIAIISVLLVVLIVVVARKNNATPVSVEEAKRDTVQNKRNTVVTSDNVGDVVDEMMNQEYVEPGYYSASMSTTWHFETGDAVSSDAYVENVPENTNDIFFDLVLEADEDTAILKSPVIPRGAELQNISLDTPLEAGTYPCVMIYHLIDEEQNTLSTLRVGVTVIVEN